MPKCTILGIPNPLKRHFAGSFTRKITDEKTINLIDMLH